MIPIAWQLRRMPLAPIAVFAQGAVARALAQHLLERDDETLRSLEGVCGPDCLIVRGETERLPWVDGVLYLGVAPEAPQLLLPTTQEPSVPLPLLERALLRAMPDLRPPRVVLPHRGQALSLSAARPVSRTTLLRWITSHS